MMLLLDVVMVDYIRFTKDRLKTAWKKYLITTAREEEAVVYHNKFLQYEGLEFSSGEGGTIFYGEYLDNSGDYSLIQASGAISDTVRRWATFNKKKWAARCTRIDIQATIAQPENWSQWDFLTRMREKGRHVTFVPSIDKETKLELATVYIGSRFSERIIRVYQKLTAGGELLLRFEVEYKTPRSNSVADMLSRNEEKLVEYLLHEIQTTKDDDLILAFSHIFTDVRPDSGRFARVKSNLDKRGKWLLEGVLPSFTNYINDHNASDEVYEAFKEVMKRRWKE